MRYARPEFLNALANDTPLPMIVDAECGMPLDLGKWESLWEEDADDTGIWLQFCVLSFTRFDLYIEGLNPDPSNLPVLDPKDAFLLGDLLTSSGPYSSGPPGTNAPTTPLAHVPWLRKTEYISREGVQRSGGHEPCVILISGPCHPLTDLAENT